MAQPVYQLPHPDGVEYVDWLRTASQEEYLEALRLHNQWQEEIKAMPFNNETNQNRVEKMCEIVGHLHKSANSNKPTQEDIDELFGPLLDRLEEIGALGGAEEPDPAPRENVPTEEVVKSTTTKASGGTKPREDLVRLDIIKNAPIEEIPGLLSVMATRLDQEMFED